MGLAWITGVSGTGKWTVRVEPARRGYQSFDTDEDGIAVWRLRTTGDEVSDPGAGNHPNYWLDEHGWMINGARVEQLALTAREQVVFLCGAVENEDGMWELFDVVIVSCLTSPHCENELQHA